MSLVRTPSRRNLAILMALSMIVGTFATLAGPAGANHPAGTCLDLVNKNNTEQETNAIGTTHTVTAHLRLYASPSTCSQSNSAVAPSAIDVNFDIETGPAVTVVKDKTAPPPRRVPPTGDTQTNEPATHQGPHDMSCTIPMGASSCQVEFTSNRGGLNVIRGWLSAHSPPDETEGRDEASAPGTTAEPDHTDVIEKYWQSDATRLDCEPETESNPAGDPHTITCTARDDNGDPVANEKIDAEASGANDPDAGADNNRPDFTCTTNAQGQCTFTHGGQAQGGTGSTTNTGTTTYRAWIDDDNNENNTNEGDQAEAPAELEPNPQSGGPAGNYDDTDTVQKMWVASPLECNPETDSNPAGTSHTITCTARDTSGNLAAGQRIHAEATGANDPDHVTTSTADDDTPANPDFTCTTDSSGQCSFTHGPSSAPECQGPSANAHRCRTPRAGTTTYRVWQDTNNSASDFEGDAGEGVDEKTQPGTIPEPDRTDVVQKLWTASNIDCNPETDRNPTGTAHSVQCSATDETNTAVTGTQIDVEAAGANDPDGSESFETPDFSCTTGPTQGGASFCTIVHGPGGIGTTNDSGTTIYAGWVDVDGSNATPEVDPDEGRIEGADLSEPDLTDVVEKIWIASRLDCTPEADTNPAQTAHTVTCTVADSSGSPSAGISIDAEATGANDPDNGNTLGTPDFSCITGSNGSCSFTHGPGGLGTTNGFGRTLYRAWIDADNNNSTSEADGTEGRDETSGPGATPSPSPSGTRSPSPTPTASAAGSSSRSTSQQVVAQQQTASPTPTPTPSATQSPSPGSSPSGGSSPSPTGSPTAQPTPSPGGTPAPSGPGQRPEPDDTDVVEKNWSAVPTRLTVLPESDTAPVGSCNAYTVTATDAAGNPVQGVVLDVEQRHERSDNATAGDEPVVSFCRPSSTDGTNPSDVDSTRGDLGGGEDGAIGGEADQSTDAQGKLTFGIRVAPTSGSTGTGNVLVTVFYENEDNDDPDSGDPQDSSTKTWTPSQARTIDCEPESASNRIGTEHVVTCTVRDVNGQPARGEGVTFSEDGPGGFTSGTERTTNDQGQATATVTSDEPGTQSITGRLTSSTQSEPDTDECDRAAGDPQNSSAGVCADTVEKRWTRAPAVQSGPCENFFEDTRTPRRGGGQVIVGTSGDDELIGTGGNDIICGLGGNDSIRGRGGSDVIVGNGGRDLIQGDRGNDRINGGGGNDVIRGEAGRDNVSGRGGRDIVSGARGRDVLAGHARADVLRGGGGPDTLRGGPGNDTLNGGGGTDQCSGGGGTNVLRRCE